jgi:hypothetical protein
MPSNAIAFHDLHRLQKTTVWRVLEEIQRMRGQADPSMRRPTTAAVTTSEAVPQRRNRWAHDWSSEGQIHSSSSNGAVNLKLHFFLS